MSFLFREIARIGKTRAEKKEEERRTTEEETKREKGERMVFFNCLFECSSAPEYLSCKYKHHV